MSDTILRDYGIEHPEPRRGAVRMALVWLALLGPPTAWMAQLCVGYGWTSIVCYPRAMPLAGGLSGMPGSWSGSLVLNLATFAAACGSTLLSFRILQRTRTGGSGGYRIMIEAGPGRTRYLAVWGFWTGVWFAIDILFNTIGMLSVTSCG